MVHSQSLVGKGEYPRVRAFLDEVPNGQFTELRAELAALVARIDALERENRMLCLQREHRPQRGW